MPQPNDFQEDRAFQRRFWAAEGVAQAAFAAVIAMALLGLTGRGGALAERDLAGAEATLTASRVMRLKAPERLELRLLATGPVAEIALDRAFLDLFEVEAITPTPASQRGGPEALLLRFSGMPGGLTIRLDVSPRRAAFGEPVRLGPPAAPLRLRPIVLP